MVIHKQLRLSAGNDSDDNGEIEVRISHNAVPGAAEDADKVWSLVIDALIKGGSSITVTEW